MRRGDPHLNAYFHFSVGAAKMPNRNNGSFSRIKIRFRRGNTPTSSAGIQKPAMIEPAEVGYHETGNGRACSHAMAQAQAETAHHPAIAHSEALILRQRELISRLHAQGRPTARTSACLRRSKPICASCTRFSGSSRPANRVPGDRRPVDAPPRRSVLTSIATRSSRRERRIARSPRGHDFWLLAFDLMYRGLRRQPAAAAREGLGAALRPAALDGALGVAVPGRIPFAERVAVPGRPRLEGAAGRAPPT